MTYKLQNEKQTLKAVAELFREAGDNHQIDDQVFDLGITCFVPFNGKYSTDDDIEYKCGSVACIGGFAYLYENPREYSAASNYVDAQYSSKSNPSDPRRSELYFPREVYDYHRITPALAAIAIDKYLDETVPVEEIWSHVNEFGDAKDA